VREIILTVKRTLSVPVECSEISPNSFAGKSLDQIRTMEIWEGNRRNRLEDIFQVKEEGGAASDELTVVIVGDASRIRKIGYRMTEGSIAIEGNAGMYLGEEMSAGSITVSGNAGAWLGSKMKGGAIEVKGNAGDFVGSSYRGSTKGMKGGTIIVHGNAGTEVGCWMRNGTIRIKGSSGMFPGMHMSNGTIYIEKHCAGRAGAQMTGGRVIIGGYVPAILPSFNIEEVRERVKLGEEKIPGPFYVFTGDLNENGNGKLFINVAENPHLKSCEEYLE
jgi:formylmethanofuran dehydrogenase subunit C